MKIGIFDYGNSSCTHPPNITFENCKFIGNNGNLLSLSGYGSELKAGIFFNKIVNYTKNNGNFIMCFYNLAVYMNGVVTLLENTLANDIIGFRNCDINFTKTITFQSNICGHSIIHVMSYDLPYVAVMDYANIAFVNNTYSELFAFGPTLITNYDNTFPHCIFQYMKLTSNKFNISKLLGHYSINFSGTAIQFFCLAYF